MLKKKTLKGSFLGKSLKIDCLGQATYEALPLGLPFKERAASPCLPPEEELKSCSYKGLVSLEKCGSR